MLVLRGVDEVTVSSRSTVVIKSGDRVFERALRDVDAVLVVGSGIKISSSLPPVLALHGIPLSILAKGHVAVLLNPVGTKYNNYRALQYTLPKNKALAIALEYLKSRVRGMASIVRNRGGRLPALPEPPDPALYEDPARLESDIRSWEAAASNTLWDEVFKLLDPSAARELRERYGFAGRKPGHPDPLNKAISAMYAVLYTLSTKALVAAGLDPTYGFLHRTQYSVPLAFDYAEAFKPLAVEAALDLVNEEGLPTLSEDGDLDKDSLNKAMKRLYRYLSAKHRETGKTPYQQIHLKAFCLAKHLEGKCSREKLAFTWDKKRYIIHE